jgi:hypothetical protein
MQRQPIRGGRLKAAGYDEREQRLELEFVDGSVKAYKGVPAEVWRRLLASPNAASYVEDRIAEEYPVERASAGNSADAKAKLDSLFGGPAPGKD